MIFPLKNLHKKIRNTPLIWKINITGILIILLFTIIIYLLILPFFESEKLDERKGKLKAVVNSAVSLIDYYEKAVRSQDWAPVPGMPHTIEDAKKEIITRLREMRYDKTEFFFILDGDGNMIMHPLKPELEGRDMMDTADPEGIKLFRQMVMESQRDGETVVQYRWDSKYSPAIKEPQITYARYYWQWDWIVCSSLYIQDIADSMKELRIKTALYEIAAAVAALALLFILMHVNMNRPLKKLLSGINEIRNGNLNYMIDISSMDEIGAISTEFNSMVNNLNKSREELVKSEKKYRELTDMLLILYTKLTLT
jgi:methyl-accepting chemotaxis protein